MKDEIQHNKSSNKENANNIYEVNLGILLIYKHTDEKS